MLWNNVFFFDNQDLLALKEEYTTRPATEETINDPTNPRHYWRYRMFLPFPLSFWNGKNLMNEVGFAFDYLKSSQTCNQESWFLLCLYTQGVHVTMESLQKDKELKTTIKDLVRASGRSCPPEGQDLAASTLDKQQVASSLEKNPVSKPLSGVPQKGTVAVV